MDMPKSQPGGMMEGEGAAPSEADLSQGYEIAICAYPDGSFGVKGPEPLKAEDSKGAEAMPGNGEPAAAAGEVMPMGESGDGYAQPMPEQGERYDTLSDALKAVVRITREYPIGEDREAMMMRGFEG